MKQNIYDDPRFFAGYKDLRDNESGLNAVLEEPAMYPLLPYLKNIRVLDIGCGFGKYCAYFAASGAASVVGIDISHRMIETAKIKHPAASIEYRNVALEDASFENRSFDLVTSSLALHYIANYGEAVTKIRDWLKPEGRFIFSVEHPVSTAVEGQKWLTDDKSGRTYWPVDDYFREGPKNIQWFVDNVIKYHRTVSTYVNELLRQAFSIDHLGEPVPSPDAISERNSLQKYIKRPAFLILSATKKA